MTNITETGEIVLNGIDETGRHRLSTSGLMVDGIWASVSVAPPSVKPSSGSSVAAMMANSAKWL